jgi:DNA modification methylase
MESAGCNEGDAFLDPFCGSGTSLLAAAGKRSVTIGCEVNPFLAFVSRTKLSATGVRSLKRQAPLVKRGAERGRKSALEGLSTFTASEGRNKWLFNTEVVRSFEGGWAMTTDVPAPTRNLLRLALIGSAMDCCNATQDGKCLRYRKDWADDNFGKDEFLDRLDTRLNQIEEDIQSTQLACSDRRVLQGDCRKVLKSGRIAKFKLCVTSPPYLNSFDYSDIYRPEMFLGKFVSNNAALRAIRLKTIRSHVQALWNPPTEDDFGPLYLNSMTSLLKRKESFWDNRLPAMVQAYFEDMRTVLRLLRKHAEAQSQLWVVVSTSAYAGVEIPVDLIIADIASKIGWSLKEIGVIRNLRSSGQHFKTVEGENKNLLQLRESAVVLTAC